MIFSENYKMVKCYQGAANAVDCDVINMSEFHHGAFVVIHTGASDTDLVLTVTESDDVAKSNTATIGQNVPIYADTDMGSSSDTLVRQSDATDYTIDTGAAPNQMVVFEVPADVLSDDTPCVYLADSGGNASNTCTILWLGEPRYLGATLPSAIV